jgi:hypothetical protein
MKYAVQVGSGAMIYILSFMRTGSTIKIILRRYRDTQGHRQHGDRISLLLFFSKIERKWANKVTYLSIALQPLWTLVAISVP